jgi:SAM-dependent methyltransferase
LAAELPLERLKAATTWMWSLGDYTLVAPRLEPCAINLADACSIRPGTTVLDVAAGNGNFAVAAVTRGAKVTASDLTPRMLELGRARTSAAGYEIEWKEGDAEALPFPDHAFDLVASVFGAMFAPQPHRVAAELFRVCRTGGLVAMANYGWDGFLGAMSKLFARYSNPLPFELPSPFEWGDPTIVRKRFEGLASGIDIRPRELAMHFDSVQAGIDFWERTNGPMAALRSMLPPERYAECRREATDLMARMNRSSDGELDVGASYLEVLARN